MFDDLPEIALVGERGIDIFLRRDDAGQRRARFSCIATVAEGRVQDHDPGAHRDPARLQALAQRLSGDPLLAPLSLADPGSWPPIRGSDPIRVFLYLDFLRAWQVAEVAADRLQRQLAADPATLPLEPGKLAGAVAPLFDFNRLARAIELARLALPVLDRRLADSAHADDKTGTTGFALRMLGDLCLRGGAAALALTCFETAIATGDNPHRRRRAIEAANALGDIDAAGRHRAAFAVRWTLPDDLKGFA